MKRLKRLIIGIIAIAMTGCGQTVVETLNIPENVGYKPGEGMTAVILPFADYSSGDNLASAHRRNLMITESLADRLTANGFALPVQEDVFAYLVNENIINLIPYEENHSDSLTNELSGDWSNRMKGELRRYITQQQISRKNKAVSSPGTHGLTSTFIAKLGRKFKADYVVRGRILEFKTRDEATWAPWKKGVLPFVIGGSSRMLYGVAGSAEYDSYNQMITGGLLGVLIGGDSQWPYDSSKTVRGTIMAKNEIVWASMGGIAGEMAANSGRVDQAVVQMRIWIQEAATGNVVWTNRVRVQVSPESVFADTQYDTLFNRAIDQGITTLVNNFVNETL